MRDFFFLTFGLTIIIFSFFIFFTERQSKLNETRLISINGVEILVEIVDTPEKRRLGLSGRDELRGGTGMFFIFETPGIYPFWMKDMNFPIDIVWIDKNFTVVGVDKNISPDTYPQSFSTNQAIQYVLEIPAGSADNYRIDVGAVVE